MFAKTEGRSEVMHFPRRPLFWHSCIASEIKITGKKIEINLTKNKSGASYDSSKVNTYKIQRKKEGKTCIIISFQTENKKKRGRWIKIIFPSFIRSAHREKGLLVKVKKRRQAIWNEIKQIGKKSLKEKLKTNTVAYFLSQKHGKMKAARGQSLLLKTSFSCSWDSNEKKTNQNFIRLNKEVRKG